MTAPLPVASETPNALFATTDARLVEIWDRMQRLQTDFCFAQELAVFQTMPAWTSARTVLDVGTGNGYYLGRLAEWFPDKRYVGIDYCEPLLVRARHAPPPPAEVTLVDADVEQFTASAPFDAVVMRLLLQHLDDPAAALARAAQLTRPGGVLFVIDALDGARHFVPPADGFSAFFEAYTAHQRRHGRDRRVGSRVADLAASTGWAIESRHEIVIPSTIPGNRPLFEENYALFIDLIETAGDLAYDFEAVRRAWGRWCAEESGYMQVGLEVVVLRMNGVWGDTA
jgi:ubiquinone/menaquinone biosynthesis C-methylase UbiE